MSLLDVADFTVDLDGEEAPISLVRELSFSVERGEFLCIVGESGSGKTVAALSLMRLLEFTAPASQTGEALLDGEDLVAASQETMAGLRGRKIAMIFQEAMEALNPTKVIGAQLIEAVQQHPGELGESAGSGRRGLVEAARAKAVDLLRQVGIPDPVGCMGKYPHQLSGGMQQRAMIAMALMCDPELLIADEPTTALDVTIQAEILTLLVRLQRERGMACILITHDMGVAAEIADRVAVMYSGRLVEIGPVQEILASPRHPYTRALLECVPRVGLIAQKELKTIPGSVPHPGMHLPGCRFAPRCHNASDRCTSVEPALTPVPVAVGVGAAAAPPAAAFPPGERLAACWHPEPALQPQDAGESARFADALVAPSGGAEPYLVLDAVSKRYAASARSESLGSRRASGGVLAVDNASVSIAKGEFFGLVGESGSGKSTLGRLIAKLEAPTSGSISVGDVSVEQLKGRKRVRSFRRDVQIVFQDTTGSLDPRQTIGRSVSEPLRSLTDVRGEALEARAKELLETVGLPLAYFSKMPSELSGGQRQRVAIARAIACDPRLVVADEPTSALDVSVQGQIVNVLRRLQRELGLTYVFITHNLSLVLSVADRIGVMYLGALVEIADAATLVRAPAHPYTQVLLQANPDPHNPRRRTPDTAHPQALGLDSETALVDRTQGCRFRDRCPRRQERCDVESPELTERQPGQFAACHFPLN
ncbi:ABC transporter ATP-binding protein [Blastococcus xanthinilyticus]|uniref:Peptide/nickel transport system ATP-binding protein n=1 Tax=Blastococcus xanthinilyticus TaxID=1564164 RepID=A0A5S5D0N7_9ACTN|nr:ABC transporter ATP-binding protein [Blastococcus xanthinilyticus]TYP89590.1 peptide/nickel transport system ATP-binding protein [Blastococcus xanthinilyticus]